MSSENKTTTLPAGAGIPIVVVCFCSITWCLVQAGVPIWWAPVVTLVLMRFIVWVAKADVRIQLIVTVLGFLTALFAGLFG